MISLACSPRTLRNPSRDWPSIVIGLNVRFARTYVGPARVFASMGRSTISFRYSNRVKNRGRPKSRPGERSESRRYSACVARVFSPERSDRIISTFGSPVPDPRTSPKHHCPRPRKSPKPVTRGICAENAVGTRDPARCHRRNQSMVEPDGMGGVFTRAQAQGITDMH